MLEVADMGCQVLVLMLMHVEKVNADPVLLDFLTQASNTQPTASSMPCCAFLLVHTMARWLALVSSCITQLFNVSCQRVSAASMRLLADEWLPCDSRNFWWSFQTI